MSRLNVKEMLGTTRIVLPTYTTVQRDALVDIDVSTLIFNKDTEVFEFWDGAAWTEF